MRLCACALVLLSKEALVEQSVQIRRYTSPYLRLNRSIARAYWVPRQINSASLYSAENYSANFYGGFAYAATGSSSYSWCSPLRTRLAPTR
jgi:hypothetical protein